MKLRKFAIAFGFILMAAVYSSAASAMRLGHFSTGSIPKSYGNCETLKSEVTNALIQATGVELMSSECQSNSSGAVVMVTYVEGSTQVALNSTRARSVYEDIAGRGYIKTQQECELRKESVVEKFKTASGLTPFLVYCTEDEGDQYGSHPWHVAIESVGTSAMSYQFMDRMVAEGISTDPVLLTNEIKDYFNARPDTVLVDVVHRIDSLDFGHISIAAFAKKYVSINKYESLSTRSAHDCAFEADELKAAAIRSGMQVIGHACQSRGQRYHETFLITENRTLLSQDSTGITYITMEACRAARTKLYEDMRARVGDSVVGIFCSNGTSNPTAYLILKPKA